MPSLERHDGVPGADVQAARDERGSGKGDHESVLEHTLAYAVHGLDHHSQYRRLDSEKDCLDETQVLIPGIEDAEYQDDDGSGQHE